MRVTTVLLSFLLSILGCTPQKAQPFGRLAGSGVNELIRVESRVFIASSSLNELKLLDVSLETPDFVRAPNPLEPLTIPVITSPSELARDTVFGDSGAVVRYVYAFSSGGNEISIVAVASGDYEFREVFRWVSDKPITALAARGGVTESELFFATFSGVDSSIHRLSIPHPTVLSTIAPEQMRDRLETIEVLPNNFIRELAILPERQLVVAASLPISNGSASSIWDLSTSPRTSKPLDSVFPFTSITVNEKGSKIFALLDSAACRTDACRGAVGFDAVTGEWLKDVRGAPMLPLKFGSGQLGGLALAEGMNGPLGASNQELGAVTTSSGEILFFNAAELRDYDLNSAGPTVQSIEFRRAAENAPVANFTGEPKEIVLTEGATRTETVKITFRQTVPGLEAFPISADSDDLRLPAGQGERVRIGDTLIISVSGKTCHETRVASVQVDLIKVSNALPNDCLQGTGMVIAGDEQPFVVTGSQTGFMGRTAREEAFSFQGSYFFHSNGFDPLALKAQLQFTMGQGEREMSPGDRYEISIQSGVSPWVITPGAELRDVALRGSSSTFNVPGAIDLDRVRQRAHVSYPSADAVLIFSPEKGVSAATALVRQ